ncbi:uncharacterized protein LOC124112569 [Haliotis rufescens]|uniref:uncharacterized protein LOC124112569 n=1 Tax=Haliotis rufescens TaxID=6454 RepID=UPI00201F4A71|nr:uncharacterized protein LOC124112569 [Haliotis rufescens]
MKMFLPFIVYAVALTVSPSHGSSEVMVLTDSGNAVQGKVTLCNIEEYISCRTLPVSAPSPRCPVYDPVEDFIYWTDFALDSVSRVRTSGADHESKWKTFTTDPYGLAIDSSLRVLFIVIGSSLSKIDVSTKVTTQVRDSLSSPTTIAIDAETKKLIVAGSSGLMIMNYDGTGSTSLPVKETTVKFDPKANVLYYSSKSRKELGSVDMKTGETTVYGNSSGYIYVFPFEGSLYFTTEEERGKVFVMSVEDGTMSTIKINGSVSIFARMTVFRKCSDGRYGSGCTISCGHCENNASCNKVTGACEGGCEPGWMGSTCKEGCRDGLYGSGCSSRCGSCATGTVCGKIHGLCSRGCKPGWTGATCNTECSDGRYGSGCTLSCGHCSANTSCDTVTGACGYGCSPGWTGAQCNTEIGPNLLVWILTGVCSVLSILVLALTVAWRCERRPRNRRPFPSLDAHLENTHENRAYDKAPVPPGEKAGCSTADDTTTEVEYQDVPLRQVHNEQEDDYQNISLRPESDEQVYEMCNF